MCTLFLLVTHEICVFFFFLCTYIHTLNFGLCFFYHFLCRCVSLVMVLKRLICSLFLFCSSFPAEVLGSYSQLLKSIDEPLFYHSAEEIAFLLSPMACKGGPNQRNSSGWKNGENFVSSCHAFHLFIYFFSPNFF